MAKDDGGAADLREQVAKLTAGCGACTMACPEYKTCFAKADAILYFTSADARRRERELREVLRDAMQLVGNAHLWNTTLDEQWHISAEELIQRCASEGGGT